MKTIRHALFVAVSSMAVAAGFAFAPEPAEASITGNCKSVELTFKNGTSGPIDIPQSGHRMRNPGSIEGWNKLTLGTAKNGLAAGSSWSNVLTLSIKCVEDAEFEIKWSDANGDHVSRFQSVNISDKQATFNLR